MSAWNDYTLNVEYESEGLTFVGLHNDEETGQVVALWQREEREEPEDTIEFSLIPEHPNCKHRYVPSSYPGIVECDDPTTCTICQMFEEPPLASYEHSLPCMPGCRACADDTDVFGEPR